MTHLVHSQESIAVTTRVHQFHSGSAYGDAVTNSMLLMQRHLHSMGVQSEVFVEHLDPALADQIRPWTDLEQAIQPHDVLIIHHSMGHDQLDWLLGLNCRKVLHYHNITPASFFPMGSVFRKYAILGREQLKALKQSVEASYADSEYNARELRSYGFPDAEILPVLVDDEKYADVLRPRSLETGIGRPWTVLFVGRVCQNKGHSDLIEAARYWVNRFPHYAVQFVCVGSYNENDPFYQDLQGRILEYGLEDVFRFAGKLSDAELLDWYARADCYLSLSRHEGFGVPLVEAMLCRLPVIAIGGSAVAETMGGAGVILPDAEAEAVCTTLLRLMRNRSLRRRIISAQLERAKAFRAGPINSAVAAMLDRLSIAHTPVAHVGPESAAGRVRIEGPCESSYSLALVNRELGRALHASGGDVTMFCTEGPGDYRPAPEQLATLDSGTRELVSDDPEFPQVTVRNLYPPRVRDARGHLTAGYFFWEESSFPRPYVTDFNLSLDVLLAPSKFIAETWRSSGVHTPIRYIGSGADHVLATPAEPLPMKLPEGFRFLHVSSCFPRKGPDVLLRAFGRAFAGRKDVSLVIKTFHNPHNRVPVMLEELRRADPDFPRVVLINEDYSPGRIRALYESCDAYVAPSRGEGFGLPMAEAMLHDLPVVVTGWGGHMDFCTPDTAHLIRYRLTPSSSHVAGQGASLWAEPDEDHLVELLQQVECLRGDDPRIANARATVEKEFSWKRVAERFSLAVEEWSLPERDFSVEPLRMGWVSTWNETCGIATYSKYLLEHVDSREVDLTLYGRRDTSAPTVGVDLRNLWKDAKEASLDALRERILLDRIEVVMIQFNFGFFNVSALSDMIVALEDMGVHVLVTLHSTKDVDKPDFKASLRQGIAGFKRATRLLAHSAEDLNRLIEMGIGERAMLFPHGAMDVPTQGMELARQKLEIDPAARIIASYGFLLPHKGLTELLEAFAMLCQQRDDVYLFMVNSRYPAEVSDQLQAELQARMDALGVRDRVRLFTEFLPESTSLCLLEAANVIVFPYQETAESASGAVRFGLAARRPVATTPLGIFSDLEGEGLRFSGCTSGELATDLGRWLDEPGMEKVVEGQNAWMSARSWPKLAQRIADMARGLVHEGSAEQ